MNERASGSPALDASQLKPSDQSLQITLNRNPIYDQHQILHAYTLLSPGPNCKTPELICQTFMDSGLDPLVGPHRALFRMTRGLLLMDYALVLPASRVILEVVDIDPSDEDLIQAAQHLIEQGYSLALSLSPDMDPTHPLMASVDLLKIDLASASRPALEALVAQRRRGHAKLLADNVATEDDLSYCRTLGIDYVQGPVFGPPDALTQARSPVNRQIVLELMTRLVDPSTQLGDIEQLIGRDPILCYKLLHLIHTTGDDEEPPIIASIGQVLRHIGMRALITWSSLLILTGFDDPIPALAHTATVRAKMCEVMARTMKFEPRGPFFLTGILSALDALLDAPLAELLAPLPIHDDITRALTHHEGEYGRLLEAIQAYENSQWDTIQDLTIDSSEITDSHLRALVWAEE